MPSKDAQFSIPVYAGPFQTGDMAVSGTPNVCPGNSYNYTVNVPGGHKSGYSYNWTYPSNWSVFSQYQNQITLYVPYNNPDYGTVRVSVDNGCGSSNYTGITVYPGYCGFNSATSRMTVFPNPSNDELTIELENKDKYQIYLLDYTGTELMRTSSNETVDQFNLDVSSFEIGIYYVKVMGKNFNEVKRVVIE